MQVFCYKINLLIDNMVLTKAMQAIETNTALRRPALDNKRIYAPQAGQGKRQAAR
jgi:hypothetical protein